MRNFKRLLIAGLVTFFSSCLDTEEKIVINADHSGTYSLAIDLGRVLKMAGSTTGDQPDSSRVKEKKDTVIYLKDLIKAADNLTAHEKTLYENGTVQVNLNEAKNEMKILLSTPFKNMADLVEIKNNFSTVVNKLKAFEKATDEKEQPGQENEDLKMGAKSVNPLGDQFTFSAGDREVSNMVTDIAAFKKFVTTDSAISMMSQMTAMTGDLNYRTIIVLPRALSSYSGPASIVSPDKKTISFYTTFSEMLANPEKVSYKVAY